MNHNYFTNQDVKMLENKAIDIRHDVLNMIYTAKAGHPGGSLSAVEVVTTLIFHVMNIDPQNPDWPDRDRFVLSKGHACPVLYAALAERGFFDKEILNTLRQYHSILQGHPDMNKVPGLDMTAGSLGNGLSAGLGMALSAKHKGQDYMTYVMLGDGECQEGMVWEAAMAASHYHLNNLVAIVDCNGVQINGWVNDIMREEPFADKWKAFGWNVIDIDGHSIREVLTALHEARTMCSPTVILARTVKGKGVSFMEDQAAWHGAAPNAEQLAQAMEDIEKGAD